MAAVAHGVAGDRALSAEDIRSATLDSIRALMLIRAYRVRGHLEAYLDPLGLAPKVTHPELDPLTYGFSEADRQRPIFINGVLGYETATLDEIIRSVRTTYCGQVGVEEAARECLHERDRVGAAPRGEDGETCLTQS